MSYPHPQMAVAIAALEGKIVQYRARPGTKTKDDPLGQGIAPWRNCDRNDIEDLLLQRSTNDGYYEWRIKPPGLRGRLYVYLDRDDRRHVGILDEHSPHTSPEQIEQVHSFVRWIDADWKEYAQAE